MNNANYNTQNDNVLYLFVHCKVKHLGKEDKESIKTAKRKTIYSLIPYRDLFVVAAARKSASRRRVGAATAADSSVNETNIIVIIYLRTHFSL